MEEYTKYMHQYATVCKSMLKYGKYAKYPKHEKVRTSV